MMLFEFLAFVGAPLIAWALTAATLPRGQR